jgi:hypothetical protein
MAGAGRGRAGAAWQCGDDLARMPAPPTPEKTKSLHAAARDTERVQTVRTAFRETVHDLDVQRRRWVDASGVHLAMTRRYGRATPGQRVVESVPDT